MTTIDRFAGCLIGLACGDALGGPAEEIPGFPSKAPKPVTEMIGGGNFSLMPGQITDDTEMALCLVRSFLEHQDFVPEDIAKKFKEWFFDSPIGAGGTVKAAMERLRDGLSWQEAGESDLGRKSLGNGSVMRCAPVALLNCFVYAEMMLYDTRIQGIITHPREECVQAAAFINLIIYHLLNSTELASKDPIAKIGFIPSGPKAAFDYALTYMPDFMKEKYRDIPNVENPKPLGTVHNTVITSVNCFLTTTTFEAALIKAVNLGGDADTIAAITGAMAGAWYGIEAIPARWSKVLVDRHNQPVYEELFNSAGYLLELAKKQTMPV